VGLGMDDFEGGEEDSDVWASGDSAPDPEVVKLDENGKSLCILALPDLLQTTTRGYPFSESESPELYQSKFIPGTRTTTTSTHPADSRQ
jgi:hypothetical protein